jgi:hypothetical protein
VTQLRDRMLEELERRNYSPGTARFYLLAVQQFNSSLNTFIVLPTGLARSTYVSISEQRIGFHERPGPRREF